jgi:hypothetical protein
MTIRRDKPAAPENSATRTPAPSTGGEREKATSNNDRWDEDEAPWRHPPVAPNDESPAESLGRSISDVVIGSPDDSKDKTKP